MADSKQGQRVGNAGGTTPGAGMEGPGNIGGQGATALRPGGGMMRREPGMMGLGGPGMGLGPVSMLRRLSDELDRVFEDLGLSRGMGLGMGMGLGLGGSGLAQQVGRAVFQPQLEIFERQNQLVVRADLPGLGREDVRVECLEDALLIEGERRAEQDVEQQGVYRSERVYGRFQRMIPLPPGVQPEKIQAVFRNGVLEVSVELPQGSGRGGRRIEIREEGESSSGGPQRRPSA